MADASLNKRTTVRLGPAVAFAQIGSIGFDGQIDVEAVRLSCEKGTPPQRLL